MRLSTCWIWMWVAVLNLFIIIPNGLAEEMTIVKYYESSGREINKQQYDAEVLRLKGIANLNGPINENGFTKYDRNQRPITWPIAKQMKQDIRADGQPVFDAQGRRLIYDRGPEYMQQRQEEDRIAAEKYAREDAARAAYENSPEKKANDQMAADMKKMKKQQAAMQAQQAEIQNQQNRMEADKHRIEAEQARMRTIGF